MVQARSKKMRVDFYVGDRTRAGLASVHRGMSGMMTGINREAGMLSAGLGGLVAGNAAFAAAGAGAAFLGFSAQAVGAFMEVEKRWAEVTTLLPQHTKRATDEMLREIRGFSRETGFALTDAIGASYQAISAGIAPENQREFLGVAGTAARAGVTDLTTSVDGLTSSLNAYGDSADKATDYSDAMFTAVRLGKTTFEEMAPVLGPLLPIAASMNTEFEEMTAGLAALTAQGNPTSIAITQMRSALVALSKDTEARDIFQRFTGMTYEDFQAGGGTFVEALKIIVDEAERTGQSVVDIFGRVEAANAALALTSDKGAETFAEAMDVTEGAAEDAAAKIEATTAVKAEKIKGLFSDIKVSLGNSITEVSFHALEGLGILETTALATEEAVSAAADRAAQSWREAYAEISKIPGVPGFAQDEDQFQAMIYQAELTNLMATGLTYSEAKAIADANQTRRNRQETVYSDDYAEAWALTADFRTRMGLDDLTGADAALFTTAAAVGAQGESLSPTDQARLYHNIVNALQESNPELFTSPELLRAGGASTEADALMNLRMARYRAVLESFQQSVDSNTGATERNTEATQELNQKMEWMVTRDESVDPGGFVAQRRDSVRLAQSPPRRVRSG